EPIPGASVTLLKKRTNGIFSNVNKFDPNDVPDGILTNPYLTKEDGSFSFFVPDGTYKLTPLIAGYNFPGSLALNSNYSKLYSNIYPLATGVEIIEKGGSQHRDIPVDSVGGQPTYFPIKIIEYSYQSDRISSVFVDGRVSHPLATINAYSVIPDPNKPGAMIRYKLIKTIQADKVGRFSLIVNQSTFDSTKNEMFGEIEAIKSKFNGTSVDTNSTPAILKLNPIMTFIQGKATSNGQVLPGATVSLLYDSSTKSLYETTADSQGYFKIPSDYIPFMPYKLRYSSGGIVTSVTTSRFILDNPINATNNKTNLFYPQYNNPKINDSIKKSIIAYNNQLNNSQGGSGLGSPANNPGHPQPSSETSQPTSKNLVFICIVLLIVIVLIGVGAIGVYLIKKNQSTSTM
ncbi:MAG TPA: carboxypeptidase-like regulatory domain-containing protein, partial [Patescibacteria group bacterium]